MLWYELQPRLLRYFKVIAAGAAEDLASETWLAVLRAIDRFQGGEAGVSGLGVHHRSTQGPGLAAAGRAQADPGPAGERAGRAPGT